MANALDVLLERGFVENISDEAGLRATLEQPISFYIGFDPTATSLHVGNLLGIMTMAQLQRHGHRPIVLIGGGTGMVGDPTGKAAARQVMTIEQIEANMAGVRPQFGRYLDFDPAAPNAALMLNNADWLRPLGYLDFLRDIGRYFSVNQMLAAETYKTRLESGLTFLEFNYMLLQAYDFLHLYQQHGCRLQMGGGDQWANCLAGADLIRRAAGGRAYVLVTPLLTTSSGVKMGKTERGSVWLDPALTSPYDYFQFWVNTEDGDVARFLRLYTFLPLDQIAELTAEEGAALNRAKQVLAHETTRLTHGEAAADEARAASLAAFAGAGDDLAAIPALGVPAADLAAGVPVLDLLVASGLAASRGAARRLIEQGGAYVDGTAVASLDQVVRARGVGPVLLRAGKKQVRRIVPT
jgi:tyrosyl-tRNA synthetase